MEEERGWSQVNLLDFISSIISSIAWPVTILLAVVVLRKPLVKLIPLLRRLKLKDLELGFEEGVEQIEAVAADAIPADQQIQSNSVEESEIRQQTLRFPRGAILEAWILLEHAAVKALSERLPEAPVSQWRAPKQLGAALRDSSLLSKRQMELFEGLRFLRNAAAHSVEMELSDIDAIKFVSTCASLTKVLKSKV